MGNLKKGWYVCESNFIQWRKNYRIWMIAAIETILIFRYLHGLSEYGQATGKTITPFVLPIVFAEAENSNGLLKVLIYLGCVMLFCNAPFLNNQKPYMILRCKRKGWYLGENMYVWLAALLYMLFISLISLIAVLPTVSTNRLWGEIAGDFVVNQRSLIPVYTWGLVMPVRVIQNYYPLAAFMYTFITGWLSIVFIGKLMYLLNLKIGKKTIGISAAVCTPLYSINWKTPILSFFIIFLSCIASAAIGTVIFSLVKNVIVSIALLYSLFMYWGFFGGAFASYLIASYADGLRETSPIYFMIRSLAELNTMGHSDYVCTTILILSAITVVCIPLGIIAVKLRRE